MHRLPFVIALASLTLRPPALNAQPAATAPPAAWLDAYREPAARLVAESLSSDFAWRRLATLTDSIGNRLSGSRQLARAIEWAVDEMKRDGLENVHAEPVMVPHWVRGRESAEIVRPAAHRMAMLGLGDSVGTPPAGIEAEALIVRSFDELDAQAARSKGRIVVFNVPYTNYADTRPARSDGPSRAARYGAVGV